MFFQVFICALIVLIIKRIYAKHPPVNAYSIRAHNLRLSRSSPSDGSYTPISWALLSHRTYLKSLPRPSVVPQILALYPVPNNSQMLLPKVGIQPAQIAASRSNRAHPCPAVVPWTGMLRRGIHATSRRLLVVHGRGVRPKLLNGIGLLSF